VRCSTCSHENPAGARFCNACGARLPPDAEAAPRPRDARAYTPPHLVERILNHRAALEGERKQVTVLFADVKGSMDLAAQVDPEEWHRILDGFFAVMAEGVHRFEGTVNQFTGDGIMALFGAPIAHEDHAQRACHAALQLTEALAAYARELRRTRGLNFSVRMGLNSGEVVVGRIGDDLRMDYTAQGHTVGLAQRVEQLAEPGRVYLAEPTATLVSGFFRLEDLGPHAVQGVREPVHVFALEGIGALRTRLEVARARGFSRFVGRDEEMAALEAGLERAAAGEGGVVGVVGEPGVGKSRLCYEFVQGCRARGLAVHEAHGVAHGKAIPFLVALEVTRSYFGVTPDDSDKAARKKIAGTLVLIDEELRAALPLVFDFLGVADPDRPAPRLDPNSRKRQLAAVIERLVHAQSRREPVVTLIEDLQWTDGGSETFLAHLVQWLAGTRNLLVVNFRPEYRAGWMESPAYRELPLRPLSAVAMTALLRELLGADPSLAGLAEHVAGRTRGNPFFIEEVVRTLVEGGRLAGARGAYRLVGTTAEIEIPPTVQAVLAARIDRLGDRDKQVLHTAAVVGKQFAEPVLRRVAALPEPELVEALHTLSAAEFVHELGGHPAAEYAFAHPLTQEVAYRSQLGERRTRVHAAVARAMTALYPEKLDERAALLAHHWEGAGDRLEAARWSRRAAEWVGTNDFPEALRHWRRVRSLLEGLPETAEWKSLRLSAAWNILMCSVRVGIADDEKTTLMTECSRLVGESGDAAAQIRLLAGPAALQVMAGEPEGTLEPLLEARRLAGQTADLGLQLAMDGVLVLAYFTAGRFREGLAVAKRGLARAPADVRLGADVFGFSPRILLLQFRGVMLREMGRLEEAARDIDDSLELARAHGEHEMIAGAYLSQVFLERWRGDGERALAAARRGLEAAEAIDSPFSRTQAFQALGVAHLLRREWDAAVGAFERALAIARTSGTGLPDEGFYLAGLAEAHLGRGELGLARARAGEAVEAAQRRKTLWAEASARITQARVLLRAEGGTARDAIAAALDRAEALIEETSARVLAPHVHMERAELARLAGDPVTRAHELREAARLFDEFGVRTGAAEVAAQLAGAG
jgi:class 3 adenylate cyclase/tetratricopeptide (TPR) repeat protein